MNFYTDPGGGVRVSTGAPGRQRRPVLAAAGVASVVTVLGLGVGLLWRVLAPHVQIIKAEQGFLYADPQPEQAVAADGWFAFLGLGAGVVVAIAAWVVVRHHRGPWVLLGLVAGSLVGAWLGWWLGVWLEMRQFEALVGTVPAGAHLEAPLSLRITDLDRLRPWPPMATGVVAAQAFAAAATYFTLAAFAADPDLRADAPDVQDAPDGQDAADGQDARGLAEASGPSDAEPKPVRPHPAEPARPEPASPPTAGSDGDQTATDGCARPDPETSSDPAGTSGPSTWPAQP